MFKFNQGVFVDVDTYNDRLHKNGYILYDRKKMQDIYYYENAQLYTYCELAKDVMCHHSNGFHSSLDRMQIFNFLTKYERCPRHYFVKRNKEGEESISIEMKKVLDKLLSNGYATEFLDYYKHYQSYKSSCGTIKKLLDECIEIGGKSNTGKQLHAIYYDVNVQQNLRFNYRDRDIVALPKAYSNTFTVEDGYFLVWGDFAQSDFRIAYNLLLRDKNNLEIMTKTEDKYEGLARLVAESEGTDFDINKFKSMRDLYKTLTLSCMYGTRDSIEKNKKHFVDMISKFLDTCPKYVEYEKRIEDRKELGLPFTVQSYFGHQEIINPNSYKGDILYKALNTPIQSGTSEVVILTVNKILDIFYDLGYTEDDISVYMVRHDEPIFKVSEKVKKDLWVFNQASTIIIDNWIPLKIDFSCGYYYKEEDKNLMSEMKKTYVQHLDKIDMFKPDDDVKEYYPLNPVLHLSIYYEKLKEYSIITICDIEKDLADIKLIKTTDDEVIRQFIYSKFNEIENNSFKDDYFSVVIYNNYYDDELFVNNRTFFKLIKIIGNAPAKAQIISQCVTYKREVQEKEELTVPIPSQKDLDYLKTIKDLNYLK